MTPTAVRRASAARTARASVEVWGVTVLAHSIAGGELPSLPWLVGVAGLVAAATAWVLREQARPTLMAPVLVACQLGLHVLFASLPPAGHAGHHAHQVVDVPPRMLAAHLVCAAVTAVVWWVRRSVVDVVLRLATSATVTIELARVVGERGADGSHPVAWLFGDPGRAPPRALTLA